MCGADSQRRARYTFEGYDALETATLHVQLPLIACYVWTEILVVCREKTGTIPILVCCAIDADLAVD